MGRKVFQDYAHVLCQRFVDSPATIDLVNLFILDAGRLEFDLLNERALFNNFPIEPFPYVHASRAWLVSRMEADSIPTELLIGARLSVDFRTTVDRNRRPFPNANFTFLCASTLHAPDRLYEASMEAQKAWGIMSLGSRVLSRTDPSVSSGDSAPPHRPTSN